MIFVDTGAWFARFVKTDPSHVGVRELLSDSSRSFVTTDYCIDETLTLLVARRHVQVAASVAGPLFEQAFARVHFLTRRQIERAAVLFRQRVGSGWSFTDCTSKIVIDDLRLQAAAALDDHFRQFGVEVVPTPH